MCLSDISFVFIPTAVIFTKYKLTNALVIKVTAQGDGSIKKWAILLQKLYIETGQ